MAASEPPIEANRGKAAAGQTTGENRGGVVYFDIPEDIGLRVDGHGMSPTVRAEVATPAALADLIQHATLGGKNGGFKIFPEAPRVTVIMSTARRAQTAGAADRGQGPEAQLDQKGQQRIAEIREALSQAGVQTAEIDLRFIDQRVKQPSPRESATYETRWQRWRRMPSDAVDLVRRAAYDPRAKMRLIAPLITLANVSVHAGFWLGVVGGPAGGLGFALTLGVQAVWDAFPDKIVDKVLSYPWVSHALGAKRSIVVRPDDESAQRSLQFDRAWLEGMAQAAWRPLPDKLNKRELDPQHAHDALIAKLSDRDGWGFTKREATELVNDGVIGLRDAARSNEEIQEITITPELFIMRDPLAKLLQRARRALPGSYTTVERFEHRRLIRRLERAEARKRHAEAHPDQLDTGAEAACTLATEALEHFEETHPRAKLERLLANLSRAERDSRKASHIDQGLGFEPWATSDAASEDPQLSKALLEERAALQAIAGFIEEQQQQRATEQNHAAKDAYASWHRLFRLYRATAALPTRFSRHGWRNRVASWVERQPLAKWFAFDTIHATGFNALFRSIAHGAGAVPHGVLSFDFLKMIGANLPNSAIQSLGRNGLYSLQRQGRATGQQHYLGQVLTGQLHSMSDLCLRAGSPLYFLMAGFEMAFNATNYLRSLGEREAGKQNERVVFVDADVNQDAADFMHIGTGGGAYPVRAFKNPQLWPKILRGSDGIAPLQLAPGSPAHRAALDARLSDHELRFAASPGYTQKALRAMGNHLVRFERVAANTFRDTVHDIRQGWQQRRAKARPPAAARMMTERQSMHRRASGVSNLSVVHQ